MVEVLGELDTRGAGLCSIVFGEFFNIDFIDELEC
jgi:hypothetical protein